MYSGLCKRIVAAVLCVVITITYIPIAVFAVDNINVVNSTLGYTDKEISELIDMISYLETVGTDYALPMIMISEGDTVYDAEGYSVASTVVPITKSLVEDQTKIKTQYWLDTVRLGDVSVMTSDENALVAYFNSKIGGYTNIRNRLKQVLIELRDYCIDNNITKDFLYSDSLNMTNVINELGTIVAEYGAGATKETNWVYNTDNGNRNGTIVNYEPALSALCVSSDGVVVNGKVLASEDEIRANAKLSNQATWSDAMLVGAGVKYFMPSFTMYADIIDEDICGIANAIKTLIGDTSIDSETYIDSKLGDMGVEEMLYAYASLYTNLLRVSGDVNSDKYKLYALVNASDYNTAKFVSIDELDSYVADLDNAPEVDVSGASDGSTVYNCVITQRFADAANEVQDLLYDTVKPIESRYAKALDDLGAILTDLYDFEELGTEEVTYEEKGDLKALGDVGDAIIDGIPANLKDAWYVLFDSAYGIDAISSHLTASAFAPYYRQKMDTLSGEWDYNASIYDAVKYVNVEKEINGNTAVVREALRNVDGSEKYYVRQSEVTPWIDMNVAVAENEYTDAINEEMFRNFEKNAVNNYYNPVHKMRYEVTDDSDLQKLLIDNNYLCAEDAGFNLESVLVRVDRYARDTDGTDKKDVLLYRQYVSDISEVCGLQVFDIYMKIRDAEYASVSEDELTVFTERLKLFDVTDSDEVSFYVDMYKRDHSGFNGHNGYVITLDFEYSMDNITANAENYDNFEISAEQKAMILEVPEYAISEYYEDNTSLFTADDIKASFLSDNSAYVQQLQNIKNNPDKLQVGETMHSFGTTNSGTNTWESLLSTYVKNKNYTTIGSIYTIPDGYSVTLPSYIPVNGRTFDTRYFVKYIPYIGTSVPSESNPNYYATAHSTDTALNSIASFVNVTSESGTGFVGLPIGSDKRNMLTVAYAQDRGARLYHTLQRVFAPIQQFTVSGTSNYNMNNHLTVNGDIAGNNGYVSDSLAVAVAEQGLPQMIWNTDSADIYNQVTGNHEYGGDVHIWISKETGLDGLRVADWVNAVPWELKDAIKATNTLTGNYQNDMNITSTEKPSRVRSSDSIVVSSGMTEGTYATWAFERDLVEVEGFAYCETCQKVVVPEKHSVHYDTGYQIVGSWAFYKNNQPGTGTGNIQTVTNNAGQTAGVGSTATNPAVSYGGLMVQWGNRTVPAQTVVNYYGSTHGSGWSVNLQTPDGNNVFLAGNSGLAQYNMNKYYTEHPDAVTDPTYTGRPGKDNAANPDGSQDTWGRTYTGLEGTYGSSGDGDDPTPPNPTPPSPPYVPSWHYSESLQTQNKSYVVCEGPYTPVALWVLGDYGTSQYAFTDKDENGNTTGIPIDFYFNGIPELRTTITTGTEQTGTCYYSLEDKTFIGEYPVGSDVDNTLNTYYHPYRPSKPESGAGGVPNGGCTICGHGDGTSAGYSSDPYGDGYYNTGEADTYPNHYSALLAAETYVNETLYGKPETNGTGSTSTESEPLPHVTIHYIESCPTVSDPKSWGVVAADLAGAAVKPKSDMDTLYNHAIVNTFSTTGSNVTKVEVTGLTGTQRNTSTLHMALSNLRATRPAIVCNSLKYEEAYVEAIFGSEYNEVGVVDDSVSSGSITSGDGVTNVGNVDVNMGLTNTALALQFYEALPGICTSNLNSMIIPLGSTTSTSGGSASGVTPNDPTERYTLLDGASGDAASGGTANKTKVLLPELKYVPWIVINNIRGVTKDDDDAVFDYTENVKVVTEDILGKELINEYRSETQKTTLPANIVPEVLMSFKEHFLTPSGMLKEYEDRGAIDTVYIASYNEYAMDLPSYSRTSVYSDINSDSFEVSSSAEATGKAAKALSSVFPVYYTGSEVNVMVSGETAPEVEFKTWVVDFDNANVGRAWNSAYTSTTADEMAQAYVDRYKGESGSFEYSATLSNTFSNSTLYTETSNAPTSTQSSTVTVDGRTQEPLTVTEDYKFDIVNGAGETNKTEKVGEYPIEIRNGRLASITANGVKYKLYGDGNIKTTAELMASDGFAVLKAADYELAEAVVHMELAEFAATLVHDGGSQTWQTYKDESIYKDNAGRIVCEEVKAIKSSYDAGFDGTDGWYAEDVTTLTIKEYALRGEIEDDYAFSYKVPIDYGYKSPRSKNDLFKSGTALYAYNELYFTFLGGEVTDAGTYVGSDSGVFDIVGDEGNNVLVEKPGIGYVISNATVDDMYTR